MEVKEVKEKESWNKFVATQPMSVFLQSWQWGELQKKEGKKIWRFALQQNHDQRGAALVVNQELIPTKNYLYCPGGPLLNYHWPLSTYEPLWQEIKKIAFQEKVVFLRIDPRIETEKEIKQLRNFGFIKAGKEIQPRHTLILDIKDPHDVILKKMKQKTRYNIRLAEKKNVKVRQSTDAKDIEIFWKLAMETERRGEFKYHLREHYLNLLDVLGKEKMASLFIAEYDKRPLAAIMVIFFKRTAVYVHGASSNYRRNLMAPHLLQWRAIEEAKKRECLFYDFYGIAPLKKGSEQENQNHPWLGITRFKLGFGGEIKSFAGAYDLVFDEGWYRTLKWMQAVRNILR